MPWNLTAWERRLYFSPKEVVLRIVIAIKNPSSSAGSEPANLGSNGKHAITRSLRASWFKIKNEGIIFSQLFPVIRLWEFLLSTPKINKCYLYQTVKWCRPVWDKCVIVLHSTMGSLSQWHSDSSGYRWKRWLPNIEDGCEYRHWLRSHGEPKTRDPPARLGLESYQPSPCYKY
jgi:hypothetical protein